MLLPYTCSHPMAPPTSLVPQRHQRCFSCGCVPAESSVGVMCVCVLYWIQTCRGSIIYNGAATIWSRIGTNHTTCPVPVTRRSGLASVSWASKQAAVHLATGRVCMCVGPVGSVCWVPQGLTAALKHWYQHCVCYCRPLLGWLCAVQSARAYPACNS